MLAAGLSEMAKAHPRGLDGPGLGLDVGLVVGHLSATRAHSTMSIGASRLPVNTMAPEIGSQACLLPIDSSEPEVAW